MFCHQVLKLKTCCVIAIVLAGNICTGPPVSEKNKAPNILYIFTDDQLRRSVSAYEEAHECVKESISTSGTCKEIRSRNFMILIKMPRS